jgi:hypothetical protein
MQPEVTRRRIQTEAARDHLREGPGIDVWKPIHVFDGNGGRAIRKDDTDLSRPGGWPDAQQEAQGDERRPEALDGQAGGVRRSDVHALFC